jgi:hypothetical protein
VGCGKYRTNRFDVPLKVAILLALPALFGLWLGLSIAGSVLVGVGYGFFTPWVSTFEAFRHDNESKKFSHCIVVKFWTGPVLFELSVEFCTHCCFMVFLFAFFLFLLKERKRRLY